MIFLKKIYSEPKGLFDEVNFRDGINVIIGRYSTNKNNKQSLNSIGKTTLIKLIDFCLLSSYNKNNPLYKAKLLTDPYYIVLEIELNNKIFVVKRSTENNNKPLFGEKDRAIEEYDIKDLKVILNRIIFGSETETKGITYRQLINLFIRDEKTGYDIKEPIKYMSGPSKGELISFNLHLLGINNELPDKSYFLRKDIKNKKNLIKELDAFLIDNYEIHDIEELNTRLYFLESKLKTLEEDIKKFELISTFEDIESNINNVNKEIKYLLLQNYQDKQKIIQYEKSFDINIDVSVNEISSLYGEIKHEFGEWVNKTLNDAISFRKRLVESRKKFLSKEISDLEEKINTRKKKIIELENKRTIQMNFLSNTNAIDDLTNSIEHIATQREQVSELNGKLKIHNDLRNRIVQLEKLEADNNVKVNEFIDELNEKILNLRTTFLSLYAELYANEQKGQFNITYNNNLKSDYRVKVTVQTDDSAGWGKGRGCILIYDLTVLLNGIKQKLKIPNFLIHDGIFNGVDINQWMLLMNHLYKLENDIRFQYIFTINESETNLDEVIKKNITSLDFEINNFVIAEYTEEAKILKNDF